MKWEGPGMARALVYFHYNDLGKLICHLEVFCF